MSTDTRRIWEIIEELGQYSLHKNVSEKVIAQSKRKLTWRQQSEMRFFLGEVERHLYGEEEFALQYLKDYWFFYSQARPFWMKLAKQETIAFELHDLETTPAQRKRSFEIMQKRLAEKTPKSSRDAYKMLAFDDKGHFTRI